MHRLYLFFVILITGCTGLPKNISPVDNFQLERYLGQWYEIARLDHSFERGLNEVTATYSMKEDGGVRVINRGFSFENNEWDEAEGKAYFIEDETKGHLKVSFFGPFYGSYVIFKLDHINYQYSYVTSHNKDYLWLLARTPEVSEELKTDFLSTVKALGYKTEDLIFVEQIVE